MRIDFASGIAKRTAEYIGLNSASDVLAVRHTFGLVHFFQAATQFFRQTDRERLPHVRHFSTHMSPEANSPTRDFQTLNINSAKERGSNGALRSQPSTVRHSSFVPERF